MCVRVACSRCGAHYTVSMATSSAPFHLFSAKAAGSTRHRSLHTHVNANAHASAGADTLPSTSANTSAAGRHEEKPGPRPSPNAILPEVPHTSKSTSSTTSSANGGAAARAPPIAASLSAATTASNVRAHTLPRADSTAQQTTPPSPRTLAMIQQMLTDNDSMYESWRVRDTLLLTPKHHACPVAYPLFVCPVGHARPAAHTPSLRRSPAEGHDVHLRHYGGRVHLLLRSTSAVTLFL